ncbi:hypothetical protein B6U80_01645 [Candidatus Pacearchaeota archaeon ex4484_26]|nr:MAG: hypothetical protein B6U80_01645 [Candidatus Pacearchaeota archaeon ex4484_26]
MRKQAAGFPIKIIVVIILILIVFVIIYLFASGTFREVFNSLSNYLGIAKQGAENMPSLP